MNFASKDELILFSSVIPETEDTNLDKQQIDNW